MNYDALSHGQIQSKLWLCEKLEPHLKPNSTIWVLGSWYNVMALLLLTRRPDNYAQIIGYDIDSECKPVADKICNAWTAFEPRIVKNITADCNSLDWSTPPDCVINCSSEHFENTTWWDHIPSQTLVCIQSSSVVDSQYPWLIKQPSPNINTFKNRYTLSTELFLGISHIKMCKQSSNMSGYDRYMMIGYK